MDPAAIVAVQALACLLCFPACAQTYYVDSEKGADAHPGTLPEKAFKTIGKAAGLAQAGDTIHLAPGAYIECVALAGSGEAGKPITIRREGEREVVWSTPLPDPKDWGTGRALDLTGKKHIVLDGLTFKDCFAWIMMRDTSHTTVRNCVFDGARDYCCIRVNNGSYNKFLNCVFKRAIPYEEDEKGVPKRGADFIQIFCDSHHNLVERCEFGEIGHVAVAVMEHRGKGMPKWNIVRNCRFGPPRWKCIGVGGAEYTLIENCTFTGEATLFIQLEGSKTIMRRNLFTGFINKSPGDKTYCGAMRIASTKGDGFPGEDSPAHHNHIFHNLFTGNQRTITSYAARFPMTGNVFKNNIIFNNQQTLWLCQPDYQNTSKNYFLHNALFGTAPGEKIIGLASDSYTLAEAQEKLKELYQGNLEVDPLFADPARDDFRLKPGSPCIDAGAFLACVEGAGAGTELVVSDPLYFSDGFGLIPGDLVQVGANAPARIVKVDYDKRTLTLEKKIAFQDKDPVGQPYNGKAPDLGPFEYASDGEKR